MPCWYIFNSSTVIFNYHPDTGIKTNDRREYDIRLKMKYHHLRTTLLFTTSQHKSDHTEFLLLFAQFQTVNWNWICGTQWYMRTISISHILFVAILFVSRYLMIYEYNSYSTNSHFVFWLTFLCYILKLTHPDNRPNHPYLLYFHCIIAYNKSIRIVELRITCMIEVCQYTIISHSSII